MPISWSQIVPMAQATGGPLMDPPTRAILVMSLLAFVLLGLGLIAGAMIGGRWVRRIGGEDLRKPLPLRRSESSPTREKEPAMLRGVHWGEPSETQTLDASETLPG